MLTLRARMNAAERNLLAEPLTNSRPARTAEAWGCCPSGELLARGDVCHVVHADRPAAEQCGVLLEDAPELVRLDEVRPAVYRVAWSLSSAAKRTATSPSSRSRATMTVAGRP